MDFLTNYTVPFVILTAWWYDPMLLKKIQKHVKKQMLKCVYNGIKTYHEYTDLKEMIKPGYHIDFVFLYTKNIKYDLTSSFRKELLDGKFTGNGCSVEDFSNTCVKPNSNFESLDKEQYCRLEIQYTFDREHYIVNFDTCHNKSIIFPLYNESELRDNIKKENNGVIFAKLTTDNNDEIDITKNIIELAGPLGDFNKSMNIVTLKQWISNQPTGIIEIITMNGETYSFKQSDNILTL